VDTRALLLLVVRRSMRLPATMFLGRGPPSTLRDSCWCRARSGGAVMRPHAPIALGRCRRNSSACASTALPVTTSMRTTRSGRAATSATVLNTALGTASAGSPPTGPPPPGTRSRQDIVFAVPMATSRHPVPCRGVPTPPAGRRLFRGSALRTRRGDLLLPGTPRRRGLLRPRLRLHLRLVTPPCLRGDGWWEMEMGPLRTPPAGRPAD
jgi:hypothetical protein